MPIYLIFKKFQEYEMLRVSPIASLKLLLLLVLQKSTFTLKVAYRTKNELKF